MIQLDLLFQKPNNYSGVKNSSSFVEEELNTGNSSYPKHFTVSTEG